MFPEGGHGLSLCNEVTSNSDAQLLPHVGKMVRPRSGVFAEPLITDFP